MNFDSRRPLTTKTSLRWYCELNLRRVRVSKTQDHKRTFVRKGYTWPPVRPRPEDCFLVRGVWIRMGMNKTVDATRDAFQPPAFNHTDKGSSADADVGRRPSSQEPFIFG